MTNTMTYPVCAQCDCVAGCSKNPEPCPILLAECIASGQVSAQQIEAHRVAGEIHSCSYYCTRTACVSAQRDELRSQLEAVGAGGVGPLMPPTAQPAKGLFVDMMEYHGPDFVAEMSHQSAQPAHAGDDGAMRSPAYNFEAINEFVHESDAQYEELQALCLGLASALESVTTQPQQSTPAVQQSAAMPEFEKYEYAPYGMRESHQGTWVQLSEVAAAWPAAINPTGGTTP